MMNAYQRCLKFVEMLKNSFIKTGNDSNDTKTYV